MAGPTLLLYSRVPSPESLGGTMVAGDPPRPDFSCGPDSPKYRFCVFPPGPPALPLVVIIGFFTCLGFGRGMSEGSNAFFFPEAVLFSSHR